MTPTDYPATGREFETALAETARKHGVELEGYFAARDLPSQKIAQPSPAVEQPPVEVVSVLAKTGVVLGGASFAATAIVAVCKAMLTFAAQNTMAVAGVGAAGILVMWAIAAFRQSAPSSTKGYSAPSPPPTPPPGEGKWVCIEQKQTIWTQI